MNMHHERHRHLSIGIKRKFIQERVEDTTISSPMPYRSELSSPPPAPKHRTYFRFEQEAERLTMLLPEMDESDHFNSFVSSTKGFSLKPRFIFTNTSRRTSMNSICISSSSDVPSMDFKPPHKHFTKTKSPSKVQDVSTDRKSVV